MASLGQPLLTPISKKQKRLSLHLTPIKRRLRNGLRPMSEGFKANCYASISHKKNCRALLFGNCDCIPQLAVTIDVPYWVPLTKPYCTPLTESVSGGVVLVTNLVLYTPISCASVVGSHLRLWACHEKDINMLHGVDGSHEKDKKILQWLHGVDIVDGSHEKDKKIPFPFLRTHHEVYGVQLWIPHDFIKSSDIGDVRYDYIYDRQLLVHTLLVYQKPFTTAPDMLDVEAEFMMYRLVRLEDWSELSTLSETSSIRSHDDEVVLDFMTLKKVKCQLAAHINFDNSGEKSEIENVKKSMEDRPLQQARQGEEMVISRKRTRAEFQVWEEKEDELHCDQSEMRSEVRLCEELIQPIDVLSKHHNGSDDPDIEINKPYLVFKGLIVKEMEELRDGIKMHLGLDSATPTHIDYWEALLLVCNWELSEAWKKDALDRARVRGEEPPAELLAEQRGLHSSIEADVKNLLEGKTYSQLEALQSEIESQMHSGTAKFSLYWEAVLTQLHIFKAKACFKEIHAKMLPKHLQCLEGREDGEAKLDMPVDLEPEGKSQPDANGAEKYSPQPVEEEIHVAEEEAEEASSFSPDGDENKEVVDPEEDKALMEHKRMAETEKVNKRRQERALDKAQHEEEMGLLSRKRARAEFQVCDKKDKEFHFDQREMRSEVRLREGRNKPSDLLSKHLDGSDDLDIEIHEPYMVYKGWIVKKMKEFRDGIKMHLGLDSAAPTHIDYWEALLVVCDWQLSEARKKDALDQARVHKEEPPGQLLAEQRGSHSSIEADVKNILEGTTYSQLEALESTIESQMCFETAKVAEYWKTGLSRRLHIFKAKVCLKEILAEMLHKHLQRPEGREECEEKLDMPDDLQPEEESEPDAIDAETYSPQPVEEIHVAEEADSFSPELLHGDENEVMDPEVDRDMLEHKRMVVSEHQRRIKEAMASKPAPPQ